MLCLGWWVLVFSRHQSQHSFSLSSHKVLYETHFFTFWLYPSSRKDWAIIPGSMKEEQVSVSCIIPCLIGKIYIFPLLKKKKNYTVIVATNTTKPEKKQKNSWLSTHVRRYTAASKGQHSKGNPSSEFQLWLSRNSYLQNLPLSRRTLHFTKTLKLPLSSFYCYEFNNYFVSYALHLTLKITLWAWC